MTASLAVIPYFAEFAVMMAVGMQLLGWNTVDMGLFASILAALSPSLVIPGMINMVERKPTLGYTPQTVLNSAPLEVVLAIILFNIFASLEQSAGNPLYPWVNTYPLWVNVLLITCQYHFFLYSGMG